MSTKAMTPQRTPPAAARPLPPSAPATAVLPDVDAEALAAVPAACAAACCVACACAPLAPGALGTLELVGVVELGHCFPHCDLAGAQRFVLRIGRLGVFVGRFEVFGFSARTRCRHSLLCARCPVGFVALSRRAHAERVFPLCEHGELLGLVVLDDPCAHGIDLACGDDV